MGEPSRYVAASDSLGRVLLLERATLVQLRVWKGYRSVQCGWLDALAPGGGLSAVLAIHAPRRELVEMWAVPAGVRLRAIATGMAHGGSRSRCAIYSLSEPALLLILSCSLIRMCSSLISAWTSMRWRKNC